MGPPASRRPTSPASGSVRARMRSRRERHRLSARRGSTMPARFMSCCCVWRRKSRCSSIRSNARKRFTRWCATAPGRANPGWPATGPGRSSASSSSSRTSSAAITPSTRCSICAMPPSRPKSPGERRSRRADRQGDGAAAAGRGAGRGAEPHRSRRLPARPRVPPDRLGRRRAGLALGPGAHRDLIRLIRARPAAPRNRATVRGLPLRRGRR